MSNRTTLLLMFAGLNMLGLAAEQLGAPWWAALLIPGIPTALGLLVVMIAAIAARKDP